MNPRTKKSAAGYASFVVLLVAIAASSNVQAQQVFYVSPKGNDAWNGTMAARGVGRNGPFASLEAARNTIRDLKRRNALPKGATVYLRGGTHQLGRVLTLTAADSGRPEAPILYMNYPGEEPIVSGGQRIEGFQPYGNGLWVADLPKVRSGQWDFKELFVNGERQQRARTPNKGYFLVNGLLDGTSLYQSINRFRYAAGDIDPQWQNIRDAEVVALHHWVNVHLRIKSIDGPNRIVNFQQGTLLNLIEQRNQPARYYVEGVFEALDSPGEWYLNRLKGQLYYFPRPDEDMSRAEIYAPYVSEILRLEGSAGTRVKNVAFRGLTFRHAHGTPGHPEQGFLSPAAIVLKYAEAITFAKCVFENVGGYGLDILDGSAFNTVTGCTFRSLGAGGVKLEGRLVKGNPASVTHDNQVVNNRFHDLGEIYASARAIFVMASSSNLIAHNEISNVPWSGIQVGYVWRYGDSGAGGNVIEFNHIHDLGKMPNQLSDLGAIYTCGEQPGGIIRNNVIHDIGAAKSLAFGVYLDGYSSNITVENNVIFNIQDAPFFAGFGRHNVVRNNVLASVRTSPAHVGSANLSEDLRFERNVVLSKSAPPLSGDVTGAHFSADRNTYFRLDSGPVLFGKETFAQWQRRGQDLSSVIADPLVQISADRFSIDRASPALALGFQAIDVSSVGPSDHER